MSTKETLLIIIVTFNSESQIVNCLRLIFKSKVENLNYKIVIVDNNSKDDTIKKVTSTFADKISRGKVLILTNQQNQGFAKAVNKGINLQKSDYYLLLNPDMYVKSGTINNVIGHIKSSKSSIVGVSTINENGKKSGSYFRLPNLMIGIFDFTNLRKVWPNDYWHNHFYYIDKSVTTKRKSFEVEVVSGGFMMIKASVIKKIGNFDERFFMYLEDVDFCLRAKKDGFRISVCGEELVHIGGASSNNRDRINHNAWINSRKIYFMKNYSFLSNIIIQVIFLFDDLIILLGKLTKYDYKNN